MSPTRGRTRAPVKSGYRRVTVSIPLEQYKDFAEFCDRHAGLTMSSFLTQAGVLMARKNGGAA